jgi:hypothetical protein
MLQLLLQKHVDGQSQQQQQPQEIDFSASAPRALHASKGRVTPSWFKQVWLLFCRSAAKCFDSYLREFTDYFIIIFLGLAFGAMMHTEGVNNYGQVQSPQLLEWTAHCWH